MKYIASTVQSKSTFIYMCARCDHMQCCRIWMTVMAQYKDKHECLLRSTEKRTVFSMDGYTHTHTQRTQHTNEQNVSGYYFTDLAHVTHVMI